MLLQTATTRENVASGWRYWGNLTKASNHNQELRPLQVRDSEMGKRVLEALFKVCSSSFKMQTSGSWVLHI